MASPNRHFLFNQKPKTSIFNESHRNPFRPPRGAAGLRRGHGSRGVRGATHGFLSFPSNSCPDPVPAPGRIRRGLRRGSREATHGCSTSPSNPSPNPAPIPGRNLQNGKNINRAGIFSLGIRANRGISSFRSSDPGESEHGSFNRGDSSSRRTSPDESATVEASLSRRWVPGGFLSNISRPSSPPPPLPPREHNPKAATQVQKYIDDLALALGLSLEESNEKSNELTTDQEDLLLLDNIQKMNLEDPKNEEENTCVICMDKPKTHAYIPCGHRVVCRKCSEELKTKGMLQCIVCRKNSHGIFQIF